MSIIVWSFLVSLSVDGGEDRVRQIAQTLQSCLELSEPLQQIQLVKKVVCEQCNMLWKSTF